MLECDDNGGHALTSVISFLAHANRVYYIQAVRGGLVHGAQRLFFRSWRVWSDSGDMRAVHKLNVRRAHAHTNLTRSLSAVKLQRSSLRANAFAARHSSPVHRFLALARHSATTIG